MEDCFNGDTVCLMEVNGGDGDGAEIIFGYGDKRVAVSVFPSATICEQGEDDVQARLIGLMDRFIMTDPADNEYDELEDAIFELIMDAGKPMFQSLSAPQIERKTPRDLHEILYPPMYHFQILSVSGKATIHRIEASKAYTSPPEDISYYNKAAEENELCIDLELPSYSTREILPKEIFLEGHGSVASLALVDGKEMFCKAQGNAGGIIGTSIARELGCLQQIRNLLPAQHHNAIRVPRLVGHARNANTSRLVGFLRQWIPGQPLRDVDVGNTPIQRRRRWMTQIRQTVSALHIAGVVWGNGKARNVIVDDQDDTWLVDFGGGWTEGWVDKDLAETVEGDNQALSRIEKFLELDSVNVLRT